MQGVLLKSLAGGGFLLMTLCANAQVYNQGPYRDDPNRDNDGYYQRDDRSYPPRNDDRYYDNRGNYSQDRRSGQRGGSPVDQALRDLDYAASNRYLSRGDRKRFEKAREELMEFQNKLYRGRFDRHELDDSINAMQRVAERDRGNGYGGGSPLWDDVQRLREFRDSYRNDRGYGYDRGYRR
jgi:hypothetical protein